MRLDDLYLVDIIEAHESIVEMIADSSLADFKVDKTLIAAVEMKLIVMGESLSSMKPETCDNLPADTVKRVREM